MPEPASAHFRDLLRTRRAELLALEDTAEDAAGTVELDQTRVGRLSRMDAMQQQAMSVETKRRRQQELSRITAALVRLDKDEFGYCLHCDAQINPARLEFDPTATLCIECASKAER